MIILPKQKFKAEYKYGAGFAHDLGDYLIVWKDDAGGRIEFLTQVVAFAVEYIYEQQVFPPALQSASTTRLIPKKVIYVEMAFLARTGLNEEERTVPNEDELKKIDRLKKIDEEFRQIRDENNPPCKLAEANDLSNYIKEQTQNFEEKYGAIPPLPMGILTPPRASANPYASVQIHLDPDGLRRSIGVFGQSGSGKSYAIGKILEELHFKTEKKVVVLDINGDYVKFKDPLEPLKKINHNDKSEKSEFIMTCAVYQDYVNAHHNKQSLVKVFSDDPSLGVGKIDKIKLNFHEGTRVAGNVALFGIVTNARFYPRTGAIEKVLEENPKWWALA